jgi:aminoglycoside phosphotransferase (APT) family kinase protein
VAEVSPLPVPRPVFVAPDDGCLAYEWLDGVPLLEVAPRHAEAVAARLGTLLRALHDVDADRLTGLVECDQFPSEALLPEARVHYDAVSAVLPSRARPAVEAFLDAAAPPPAGGLAFSHNDLGIEHVLVEPGTMTVSGVIDWSDAALADPARDFGLIHRDLGPRALDAALSAFGAQPGEEEALRRTIHEPFTLDVTNGQRR